MTHGVRPFFFTGLQGESALSHARGQILEYGRDRLWGNLVEQTISESCQPSQMKLDGQWG
jgi:hypothetical protein